MSLSNALIVSKETTETTTETTTKATTETTKEDNDFTFYETFDKIGNDVGHISAPLDRIKEYIREFYPRVNAYNSLGFIKANVNKNGIIKGRLKEGQGIFIYEPSKTKQEDIKTRDWDTFAIQLNVPHYWDDTRRYYGCLAHFGHFHIDFLISFIHVLRKMGLANPTVNKKKFTIINAKPHQFIPKVHVEILKVLLGPDICFNWNINFRKAIQIDQLQAGPYPSEQIESIYQQANDMGLLIENNQSPKVVLLNRIEQTSTNRYIRNTEEVFACMQEKYGDHAKAVDPASLTYQKQIELFHNAEIVIGLFGSSFMNVLWMKPYKKVVQIGGQHDTLRLCQAKKLTVTFFPMEGYENVIVDTKLFRQSLPDL